MKNTIKILRATTKDIQKFTDLTLDLLKNQTLPFKSGGPTSVQKFIDSFLRSPTGICYVAQEKGNDQIIGWIGASIDSYMFSDEKVCKISAWDVKTDRRDEGIGGELLKKVMMWSFLKDVHLILVGVNVDSSNVPEYAFSKLQNAGFKEFERTFYLRIDRQ